MKFESDEWLAGIFGHPVYRVQDEDGRPPSTGEVLGAAGRDQALFYTRVPVGRVDRVANLTGIGFHVIDVTVTFEREPAPSSGFPRSSFTVRRASPRDRDRLLDIAGSCFVYSRFHADPLIPRATANAVKRGWIANYLAGKRGEALFVADTGGEPVGFLAVMAGEDGRVRTRVIDLIGVDPRHQGRGAGTALVAFFIGDSLGTYDLLRVGTQIANLPSLRLYEGCGFRISGASYVLHAHASGGSLRRGFR
jgi:ribosomal protein S18 acetylase RimI-like enzyme